MKVITIYPSTIGASYEYSEAWKRFIKALGWDETTPVWQCAYVINVEVTD